MTEFLETCKARVQESQARLQEAQQKLQVAQAVFQLAAQEANGWQLAFASESKRIEQAKSGAPAPMPTVVTSEPQVPAPIPVSPSNIVNKTDAIRNLLRQHPTGMTPAEIWKEVRSQFVHRPYLYSVLKRLSDKDEIKLKRKKYFFQFQAKAEEGKDHVLVQ